MKNPNKQIDFEIVLIEKRKSHIINITERDRKVDCNEEERALGLKIFMFYN